MDHRLESDPIWLDLLKRIGKILVFLILVVLVFCIGILVGYSILGEGSFWEAFNKDTWLHIVDFLK